MTKSQVPSTKSQTNHKFEIQNLKRFWSFEFGILKLFVICILLFGILGIKDANAGTILQRPLYFGLTNGLVGSWSFDAPDMAGNIAYDRSGQGNNGTLTNGPARAPGKVGQALKFDGSDDYVNAGSGNSLFPTGPVTITAWVNLRAYGAQGGTVLSSWGTTAGQNRYAANWDTNGKLTGNYRNTADTATVARPSTASIGLNVWSFVATVIDGPNSIIDVYVNGSLDNGTLSGAGAGWHSSIPPVTIGRLRVGDTYGQTNGLIDEVRVYNRALSPDEIKRLYNMGATTKFNVSKKQDAALDNGLVGLWTFDAPDMSGTTAYDRSGQGNNGTLTNGPTRQIGKIGQALSLAPSGNVNAGNGSSLNVTDNTQSISFWIQRSSANQTGVSIIDRGAPGSPGSGYTIGLGVSPCTANQLKVTKFSVADICVGSFPTNTNWHHVVVVWNSSGEFAYIDGVLSSPTGTNTGNFLSSTNNFVITGLNSLIDEVRIYNRALSADEIKRLYNMGATTKFNVSKKQDAALNNGLVGLWTFDAPDMAGVTAYDRSGQGNTGTLTNGPTKTIGKIGQALNFDGVDDVVDAGSGSSLNMGGSAWTVSAWIKTTDTNGAIVCKDQYGTGGCKLGNADYYVLGVTSGIAQFEWNGGDSASKATANGTSNVADGTWHHIVGIRPNNGDKTAEIYVDGIRQAQATHSGQWTGADTTQSLRIGQSYANTEALNGLIDEVRVYNRALSAEEIKRLYNLGR